MFYMDGQILLFIQEHLRNAMFDFIFKGITHLGDAGIFWILLTVVLLCFRQTRRAGIYSAGASFASAVSISRQLPRKMAGFFIVLASLIAFSRLYVGIHYPTDVLGGLVTGIGIGLLVNVIGDRLAGGKMQGDHSLPD